MDLFNTITSNGCREMTEERFNEALREYKQSILTLVDSEVKFYNMKDSGQSIKENMYDAIRVGALLTLKQKIEAL